jgi:hypothetical protein
MDIDAIKAQLPRSYEPLLLTFYGSESRRTDDLLVIGDDYGTELCLNLTDGCIYSIDPEKKLATRFVNSNVECLGKFLTLYEEREKELRETLNEKDQDQIVRRLREQFVVIDAPALAEPENWWSVILEQKEQGLL